MTTSWSYVLWGTVIFTVGSLLSLLVVLGVVVCMPATYFLDRPIRRLWANHHPVVQILLLFTKNIIGVFLLVAGILLSLPGIPGQGILTVLIGVMLLDFPGKRRWERKLVGRPRILSTINRLRCTFGRPPLQLTDRN